MDTFLQDLQRSPELIVPLAYGLAAFALLLLVGRLLRRSGALRVPLLPYVVGAATLGFAIALVVGLERLDLPIDLELRNTLLAILLLAWGLVGLGLIESLLFERWILRSGVAIPRLMRDIGRAIAFIIVVPHAGAIECFQIRWRERSRSDWQSNRLIESL